MTKLIITSLNHDLQAGKSYVSFVWSDDPNKRLGLEVPFGTTPTEAKREAEAAVRKLAEELLRAEIVLT